MTLGRFIVIEGTDGAGKTTQVHLLSKFLETQGRDVKSIHFPRYGQPSAYFVEQYLAGKFGQLNDIGPYKGSLFYAMDRYAASFEIRTLLDLGTTVIADRYIGSNLGHQGAKIDDTDARRRYYDWAQQIEFEHLGIPQPDINVVLIMPAATAQKFIDAKPPLAHLGGKNRDIHENDLSHLRRSEHIFAELCELYPKKYLRVDCAENGHILPVEQIQSRIQDNLLHYL